MSEPMPTPEQDARLPILEAEIERRWQSDRPKYYDLLMKEGALQKQVKQTALMCVDVLQKSQQKGLHPDQAQELIQDLIVPQD